MIRIEYNLKIIQKQLIQTLLQNNGMMQNKLYYLFTIINLLQT